MKIWPVAIALAALWFLTRKASAETLLTPPPQPPQTGDGPYEPFPTPMPIMPMPGISTSPTASTPHIVPNEPALPAVPANVSGAEAEAIGSSIANGGPGVLTPISDGQGSSGALLPPITGIGNNTQAVVVIETPTRGQQSFSVGMDGDVTPAQAVGNIQYYQSILGNYPPDNPIHESLLAQIAANQLIIQATA